MLINLRNAMMTGKRLPYDAEVEYLQSTGTQWIDVDTITTDFWFECDIKITTYNDGNIGFVSGNMSRNCYLNFWRSSVYPRRGKGYPSSSPFGSNGHLVRLDATGFYIDGILQPQTFTTLAADGNGIFRLFGARTEISAASGVLMCQIYAFRCGPDLTTTSRDMIPVRFTNEQGVSEGAMYDLANPTVGMNPDGSPRTDGLYRNQGTGAFIVGPDKNA